VHNSGLNLVIFGPELVNTGTFLQIMAKNNNKNTTGTRASQKSFMTAGPTLHYSHANVVSCWLLALAVYILHCLFWPKIVTGEFLSFRWESLTDPVLWQLGQVVTDGVSIFEYPWQIVVLGLMMGSMAAAPVLISQLMSFRYSVPFIAVALFVANLPGLAAFLIISCVGAACRPLRFRSRFIAIVLCTLPLVVYWFYFGVARGLDPIQWGFSVMPWIAAWLIGLSLAAAVLGIGHFTRYKPGLMWIATGVLLVLSLITFEHRIGFAELDYQLYVADNDPETVPHFQSRSISEAIDETLADPAVRQYLQGFFYPADEIRWRQEIKRRIENQLTRDRWPSWFAAEEHFKYQQKRLKLQDQYDKFIRRRPNSPRVPIALYYKAMLLEYSPNLEMFRRAEILSFYDDHPREQAAEVWYRLYNRFSDSPESFEARWRIAKHWSGAGRFEHALTLLASAESMIMERLDFLENQAERASAIGPFRKPPESAMTRRKLTDLLGRVRELQILISGENRDGSEENAARLAEFVMLNPYSRDYPDHLERLLEQMDEEDPMKDNVLLAQIQLIEDADTRAEKLRQLHRDYQDTDAGRKALYELGRLRVRMWQLSESGSDERQEYLESARATLTSFTTLYPNSIYAEDAEMKLYQLPDAE